MLEALGLGPVEEAVYDRLLTHARLSVARLLALTDARPDELDQALETLVVKGLARRLAGAEPEFVAAPPDYAIEALVGQQMTALQAVRASAAELAARYRRAAPHVDPAGLIEVVTGGDSVRQLWHQIVQTAREEIAVFDAPPYAVGVDETMQQQEQRITRDGLRFRTVFERSLLEDPAHVRRIMAGVAGGEEGRIARVPLKLVIIDREWGLLPLTAAGAQMPEASVIVRESVLLDSMIALFESVWENAVEVHTDAGPGTAGSGTAELQQLARLLATGLTDVGIAHHLGVSERTVRRRIKELFDELRVHSRFQAGVRAHERGWI